MNIHTSKIQEHKTNDATNGSAVKQSREQPTFQFEDNRSEIIAQREIKKIANNSEQVKQLKALQTMVKNSHRVNQLKAVQTMASDHTVNTTQLKAINAEEAFHKNLLSTQKKDTVDVIQRKPTRDASGKKIKHQPLNFEERHELTKIQSVIKGTTYETILNFLQKAVLEKIGKPALSEFYKGAHIIFNDAGAVYNQLFQLAQPIAEYRAQTWTEWWNNQPVPQTPENLKPSTSGGGGLGGRMAGTNQTSHYADAAPGTSEKTQLGIDLPSPCQGHILIGLVPNQPKYGNQAGCTFVQTEMYGFLTYYDKYVGHLGGAIKNKFWALQSGLVGTSTHSEKTQGGSTAIIE